ncbi:transposase [Salmonella enterica]|nr:transposase [Salmonella enterica]EJR3519422.1 transposase [Salmonella enterica]
MAQVVASKYRDYQQHIFARSDIVLSVGTMAARVGRIGVTLVPQAELLHKALLKCPVRHADETKMRIQDDGALPLDN